MKKEFYFLKIAQFFFSISGGIASGICAEGYGVNILENFLTIYIIPIYYSFIFFISIIQVCCIFDISCGGKSSKNLTYFSYSGSTINGAVCTAQICRSSENICQFRLDMDVFVISDADNCMLKIEYLSTSELSL